MRAVATRLHPDWLADRPAAVFLALIVITAGGDGARLTRNILFLPYTSAAAMAKPGAV